MWVYSITVPWILLLIAAAASTSVAADVPTSTSSHLTVADKIRLKKVLEPGHKLEDLAQTHYTVLGYKYLKEPITRIGVSFVLNGSQ